MAWLTVIAVIAALILYLLSALGPGPPLALPALLPGPQHCRRYRHGWLVDRPIAIIAILATANTVNLTDGLGPAGGTTAIAFTCYGIIAFLQRQEPVVPLCFATVGALLAPSSGRTPTPRQTHGGRGVAHSWRASGGVRLHDGVCAAPPS